MLLDGVGGCASALEVEDTLMTEGMLLIVGDTGESRESGPDEASLAVTVSFAGVADSAGEVELSGGTSGLLACKTLVDLTSGEEAPSPSTRSMSASSTRATFLAVPSSLATWVVDGCSVEFEDVLSVSLKIFSENLFVSALEGGAVVSSAFGGCAMFSIGFFEDDEVDEPTSLRTGL